MTQYGDDNSGYNRIHRNGSDAGNGDDVAPDRPTVVAQRQLRSSVAARIATARRRLAPRKRRFQMMRLDSPVVRSESLPSLVDSGDRDPHQQQQQEEEEANSTSKRTPPSSPIARPYSPMSTITPADLRSIIGLNAMYGDLSSVSPSKKRRRVARSGQSGRDGLAENKCVHVSGESTDAAGDEGGCFEIKSDHRPSNEEAKYSACVEGSAAEEAGIAQRAEKKRQRDVWVFLPEHILALIFSFHSQSDIAKTFFMVCKRWYRISRSSRLLWRVLDFGNTATMSFKASSMGSVLSFVSSLVSDPLHIDAPLVTFNLSLGDIIMNGDEISHRPAQFMFLEDEEDLTDEMDDRDDAEIEVDDFESNVPTPPHPQHQQRHPSVYIQSIVLPKNCADLTDKNLFRLRQLYPWLKELTIPPTAQSQQQSSHTGAQTSQQDVNTNPDTVHGLDDSGLKQLARFPMLTKLKLTCHDRITDHGIETLCRVAENLADVAIDYCPQITSASFHHLVRHCGNLKALSILSNSTCIIESDDIQLLSSPVGKQLREIRMDLGKSVSHESFRSLVANCSNLRALYLRGCQNMTGKSLQLICSELYYLESVTIMCGNGTRIVAPIIESFSLKSFQLIRCSGLIEPLFACPQLQSISVDHCGSLYGMRFTGHHPITELRFRSCTLTGINFKTMLQTQLPHVREIEFFECKLLGEGAVFQSASLEKMIMFKCDAIHDLKLHCPKLTTVSIDLCSEIKSIHFDCPVLENLQLFVLPQIQQPKLHTLCVSSEKLRTLNLQRTVLLERLEILCPQLDSLNMAGCRNLKQLTNIECPKVDKLALGSAVFDFNNQIVPLMLRCNTVSMLSVSHSVHLTDRDLQTICSMLPQLKALVISNCSRIINPTLDAPQLKGIQLTECSSLQGFTINSPLLSKFFLRGCPMVTDAALSGLKFCSQVKFIEVFGCSGLRNPVISGKEITDIHFSRCPQLENPILDCPSLRKLLFLSCERLTDMSFTSNCPYVAEILFSECPLLCDEFVYNLQQRCPNVQAVVFSKCHSLKTPEISGFKELKVLRFGECDRLMHPKLTQQNCSTVKLLSFSGCKSLDFGSPTSSVWPAIRAEQVEFNKCDSLQELIFDVASQSLVISQCRFLRKVTVRNEYLQKIKLAHCSAAISLDIFGPSQLKDIAVHDCRELTHIDFHNPGSRSESIRSIEVANCPRFSDMSVTSLLNKCPQLRSLSLASCGLTRAVIRHHGLDSLALRSCGHLEHVTIDCARLQSLTIAECSKLQFHRIGCQISAVSFSQLERLEMSHVKVQDEFMRQVMAIFSQSAGQLKSVSFDSCSGIDLTSQRSP